MACLQNLPSLLSQLLLWHGECALAKHPQDVMTLTCTALAKAGFRVMDKAQRRGSNLPLQAKLAQLHRHAEVMLESVLNNPNITEESVKAMAQHERCSCGGAASLAAHHFVKQRMQAHKVLVSHQHGCW